MPAFSDRSKRRLATCHPDLRVLFNEVIRRRDCTVLCGVRSKEEQEEAYRSGRSQVRWPDSKHNIGGASGRDVSWAVDVAPYPIDWQDGRGFALFAGYVLAVADGLRAAGRMQRRVRWGGDWNGNGNVREERFFDGPHFELEPCADDRL